GKDPATPGNVHLAAVGMQLPDDSWLNIDLLTPAARPTRSDKLVLWTTLVALGVVLGTSMVIRCLTRPLELFASAVRNLYAST
ncbi:hypothetical protein, partial [Serratia marcescens]|uniref:hypothetical protein n=1 Tax=Serratia marcescens TaxID=615 RepID=UPI001952D0D9